MKVLSGIQPTGRFHWGNYFGAIRQYIALQGQEQSFYFIADLHALTTVREPVVLRQNIKDAALDLLALGLDPAKATLFRQSDVPEVTELTWLLMTITQMHLLDKCHAFKDKKAKGIAADAGLFAYPVLMAADILIYDSTTVPVGADQIQHVEVTRDLAQRFNATYGETLHLPEAYVLDDSAKVPGTDREKMSKSYNNTIPIFETPRKLRKIIMSIQTDSTPMEAAKVVVEIGHRREDGADQMCPSSGRFSVPLLFDAADEVEEGHGLLAEKASCLNNERHERDARPLAAKDLAPLTIFPSLYGMGGRSHPVVASASQVIRAPGVGHCNVQQEGGRAEADGDEGEFHVDLPDELARPSHRLVFFLFGDLDLSFSLEKVGEELDKEVTDRIMSPVDQRGRAGRAAFQGVVVVPSRLEKQALFATGAGAPHLSVLEWQEQADS